MAILGIVAASIGIMMMATFTVKESTTYLESIILRKGGTLTAFGGN